MGSIYETLREKLKQPLFAAAAGVILGIALGLFWGWVLDPVEYVDTTPESMRADLQVDYLRMTVDSFSVNGDTELALRRYKELGAAGSDSLLAIQTFPESQDLGTLLKFSQLVTASEDIPAPEPTEPGEPTPSTGGTNLFFVVIGAGLLGVVGVGVLIYMIFFRNRVDGDAEDLTPAQQARALTRQTELVDYEAMGSSAPISQFVTTYVVKDDLFDDSFSIDSPSGEFLGECGVGISETIGVGDPKRVTAFEVWLFDKNDIQTVTKVLMSAHAFNDLATRQRLEEKGEPVLVEPQRQVLLETQTLQLVATISDAVYGNGSLPETSFFERMTLELAVWPKEA